MPWVNALHPTGNLAPYDASRVDLQMLTRSLAVEFASPGIRERHRSGRDRDPGAGEGDAGGDVAKRMEGFLARIPPHRTGEPDDIARATLFLASPAASYVTGVMLEVDGDTYSPDEGNPRVRSRCGVR